MSRSIVPHLPFALTRRPTAFYSVDCLLVLCLGVKICANRLSWMLNSFTSLARPTAFYLVDRFAPLGCQDPSWPHLPFALTRRPTAFYSVDCLLVLCLGVKICANRLSWMLNSFTSLARPTAFYLVDRFAPLGCQDPSWPHLPFALTRRPTAFYSVDCLLVLCLGVKICANRLSWMLNSFTSLARPTAFYLVDRYAPLGCQDPSWPHLPFALTRRPTAFYSVDCLLVLCLGVKICANRLSWMLNSFTSLARPTAFYLVDRFAPLGCQDPSWPHLPFALTRRPTAFYSVDCLLVLCLGVKICANRLSWMLNSFTSLARPTAFYLVDRFAPLGCQDPSWPHLPFALTRRPTAFYSVDCLLVLCLPSFLDVKLHHGLPRQHGRLRFTTTFLAADCVLLSRLLARTLVTALGRIACLDRED